MLFLIVLAVATGLIAALRRHQPFRYHARIGLAIAMAFAGAAHLFMPEPFVQHLPEWVPERHGLIYASGLAEIALGAALIRPARWRHVAGLALAAYLVAVFPANVYVAVEGIEVDGQPGGVYPWLRLPFQALFDWLALWVTDVLALLGSRRTASAGAHIVLSTKGNVNASGEPRLRPRRRTV
jgi:uncharacterized membrane protein